MATKEELAAKLAEQEKATADAEAKANEAVAKLNDLIAAKDAPVVEPSAPADPFHDQGGRFANGLKYIPAIYVDSDRQEYDARICPLPTNKGVIGAIPSIDDPQKAFAAISLLPLEQQIKAVQELQAKLATPEKALLLNGKTLRLMEYKGHLLYTLDLGNKRVPCAELYVNFKKDGKSADNWKTVSSVLPRENVSFADQDRTVPHFKLKG